MVSLNAIWTQKFIKKNTLWWFIFFLVLLFSISIRSASQSDSQHCIICHLNTPSPNSIITTYIGGVYLGNVLDTFWNKWGINTIYCGEELIKYATPVKIDVKHIPAIDALREILNHQPRQIGYTEHQDEDFGPTFVIILKAPIFCGRVRDSIAKSRYNKLKILLMDEKNTIKAQVKTDVGGNFLLDPNHNPTESPENYRLVISLADSIILRRDVRLGAYDRDLGTIYLPGSNSQKGSSIDNANPISMGLDDERLMKVSVERNIGGMRMSSNANALDFLRLLPRFQLMENGDMGYNGGTINRLLINNQEVKDEDLGIFLRKLRAHDITKVQFRKDRLKNNYVLILTTLLQ